MVLFASAAVVHFLGLPRPISSDWWLKTTEIFLFVCVVFFRIQTSTCDHGCPPTECSREELFLASPGLWWWFPDVLGSLLQSSQGPLPSVCDYTQSCLYSPEYQSLDYSFRPIQLDHLLITLLRLQRPNFQISFIGSSRHEFWRDTVQPTARGLDKMSNTRGSQILKCWSVLGFLNPVSIDV